MRLKGRMGVTEVEKLLFVSGPSPALSHRSWRVWAPREPQGAGPSLWASVPGMGAEQGIRPSLPPPGLSGP